MLQVESASKGKKPKRYIITGDLRILVSRWIGSNGPFYLPDKRFFSALTQSMTNKLTEIFNNEVEIIHMPYEYIKTGLMMLLATEAKETPIVSLDQVYIEQGIADKYFDTNRIVRWSKHVIETEEQNGWFEIGHGPRNPAYSISHQLEQIKNQGRIQRMVNKRVIVVDDGIWTRQSLIAVQRVLESAGIQVEKFIVGLEIRPQNDNDCITLEKPFHWVEKFIKEDVIDWVSERDFYPGVPFSGRTLGEKIDLDRLDHNLHEYYHAIPMEGNYGAPYVYPLGDPRAWASIPADKVLDFSRFCLKQAICLYQSIEYETEKVTGLKKPIQVKHLPRPPYFYRKNKDSSVIEELKRSLETLN